ncbi:MAG: hypothetical protein HDT29_06785 [Clostridiales bacterium]|nr:hypothetical protein [Clostridiales bacterium]
MLKRKISNKESEGNILLDEMDFETDESFENFQSYDEVKGFVKDVYKNIKTLYGVYDPNHKSKFERCFLICVAMIFAGTPFGLIIWNLIAHKFQWWVNLVLLALGIFFSYLAISFLKDFLSTRFKAYVYFYKIGDKTITIYKQTKGKHITIYLSKKKVFRKYRDGDWQEISYDEDEMMGKDLLFSKFRCGLDRDLGYTERKNGDKIVYSYNKELRKRTTVMTIQDGVLQSIKHCKLHYDNEAKLRINAVDLLTGLEVNSMRSCDIPKSFLEFWESREIEFPKENEYLYFV